MYECDKCGKNSEPKEKCNVVPCEIRIKHYKESTTGTEIVKERKLCNVCANNGNVIGKKINPQDKFWSTPL